MCVILSFYEFLNKPMYCSNSL